MGDVWMCAWRNFGGLPEIMSFAAKGTVQPVTARGARGLWESCSDGGLVPLNDGTLVPLEEATYDDIREAYYADLRNAFVQAGETEDMPEVLRESFELRRLREGLGSPRAPTVARPPGYPGVQDDGLVVRLEQPVYHMGPPGDVVEGQSSHDDSEESTPTAGSTTSGGARRLLETGSDATSCSRGDSGVSHQSSASRVASLGIALIPHAQGAPTVEEISPEGSWELWIVLGLIVVVSMGVGVLGAWCVGRYMGSSRVALMNQQPADSDRDGVAGDQVSTPVNQAASRPQTLSPVINIMGVYLKRSRQEVWMSKRLKQSAAKDHVPGLQDPRPRVLGV